MDESYTSVILITFFGFCALAAVLLVPVYLFLRREEEVSEGWTEEALEAAALAQDQAENEAKRSEQE